MLRTRMSAVAAVVVLTATLGAGSAGSAVAASAGSAGSAVTPRCATAGLKVTLSDGGQAGSQSGMGHAGQFLRFQNTGTATCVLYGYPGLGLETSGHKPLKTKAAWGRTYFAADPGKHPVTLKRGASAWADLGWTQTGNRATKARYLKVTPPGSKTYRTVSFERNVDGGALQVTALSKDIPRIG